jgi:hypothetical protein
MKKRGSLLSAMLFVVLVLSLAVDARAACDGSTMSSGNYCVYRSGFGTVGGSVDGANNDIAASNMYPIQQRDSESDLKYWYDLAFSDYGNGLDFRNSLLLLGVNLSTCGSPESPATPLCDLLLNPKKNYETIGFVTTDTDSDGVPDDCKISGDIEAQLANARDTFAYDVVKKYPDVATAKTNLGETLKALSNIYLMIADEFLIDALEFRFSSFTLGADQKLDEQLLLLTKAQLCYEKSVNSFIYGMTPIPGTTIYISDYFDNDVFGLFNLSVERMSMAVREKSSKQLVRMISPDPLVEANARKAAAETLKNVYTSTYLLGAVIAQKPKSNFFANGGNRLVNALSTLRNQGNIYTENLNPLGYDNRYIPMQDFSKLYSDAMNFYSSAKTSQDTLAASKRDFDANVTQLQTTLYNLAENPGGYKTQLASLTGISVSDPDFINKAAASGEDLYACPIDAADFVACVQNKTKGVLGSKYNQLREAQIRVDQAMKKKDNQIEAIDLENKRHAEIIEIKNKYYAQYKDTLKNYLKHMKDARTVVRKKTEGDGESKTETTYSVKDEPLNLSVDKEIDLQKALADYEIAQINVTDEVMIKNMVNNLAETEIEIGLAIQMKNSVVDEFENGLKERDNLAFVYKKALEQINYTANMVRDKIPEVRILRSQAALDLSKNLNNSAHYAYLAAKALEYKYLKQIVNLQVLNQTLSIYDLYKVQTVEDVKDFLDKLDAYDSCAWGLVSRTTIKMSLAKDILGLTDKYLNPAGTLSATQVAQLRYQGVQSFLSGKVNPTDNSLLFDFASALNDYYISKWSKYNLKIWWGTASPPCDPVPTKGIAVNFLTNQSASITPLITLSQKGHSTYLDKTRNILEYVPVSEYLNMLSENTDSSIVTTGIFAAYVNGNPETDVLWDPSFKGRSVASSNWEFKVNDIGDYPIDWSKVTDIVLYLDAMGSSLQ